MKLKYILPIVVVLSFFVLYTAVTHAETLEPTATPAATETPNPSETPRFGKSPEPSETPRVKGEDRLENKRLEFCQRHEEEITNKLGNLGGFVSRVLGTFDAIATRVENFYTNKVAPTHPISNYTALVADIASKRALAVTALTNAQADINGFTCTAANPKGQIIQYRIDMQTVKRALKDYRTSIKNLIVAVKSVVGETESSPKPTETPEATETPKAIVTPTPSAT